MSKIKINEICIEVDYNDENGSGQRIYKIAQTFESAQEALGKLERFIEKLQKDNDAIIKE